MDVIQVINGIIEALVRLGDWLYLTQYLAKRLYNSYTPQMGSFPADNWGIAVLPYSYMRYLFFNPPSINEFTSSWQGS